MENQPKFIKEFAKDQSDLAEVEDELSPRQEVASQIRDKRNEAFDREKTLVEKRQELEELAVKVAHISENVPRIITNYFKLRKLKAELASKTSEHQDLAMADAEKQIDGTPEEFQQAEQMLSDYYQRVEQDWVEGDYTKEEVEKYFTEEYLSSLMTEDYIKLLQRFPASFVTHVTRHGLRDHIGMIGSTGGLGEVWSSFKDILHETRLKPTYSVAMDIKDHFILKSITDKYCVGCDSEENALTKFRKDHDFFESSPRITQADHLAVHFAANEVANEFYGAESGNEVFIVYPSMSIVGHHLFHSEHDDAFAYKDHYAHSKNNIYAWDEASEGLSLDAGIVFIPKSTEVDPDTGSKYIVDSEGRAVKNTDLIAKITLIVAGEEFQKLAHDSKELSTYRDSDVDSLDEMNAKQEVIRTRLIKLVSDSTGLDLAQSESLIYRNQVIKEEVIFDLENDVTALHLGHLDSSNWVNKPLRDLGLLYKKAENTIPAELYWEQYFAEYPDQRPAHIVYYDGDPTEALRSWQQENGITKPIQDNYLGYESQHVSRMRTDERLDPIIDRYIKLVETAIHEHYRHQESEIAA